MASGEISLTPFQYWLRASLQHYDERKYWKRYWIVTDANSKIPLILRYYYLYYLKRCDAFNNATMGAHMGLGAKFAGIPGLPHGLYGIVVSHNASIGRNVQIYHQVTIGNGRGGAPCIGDNVVIGAGAKLLGNIRIGNNVLIGAGAVVTFDVPDNCIVKSAKGTIIQKEGKENIVEDKLHDTV